MATRKNKKVVPLSSLGNQHTKVHLLRFYPFLKDEFRKIEESDFNSKEVFAELFGESAEYRPEFIRAIYTYQQCDTKHKTI